MPQTSFLQRVALTGLVCLVAIANTGCLVNVTTVSDPDRYFEEARRGAEAVAGRRGPAQKLHIVAYDADERKLVRLSLPIDWIDRVADGVDIDLDDFDGFCDSGDECRDARRKLRKLRGRDLRRLPLGPLVEVNDDGGERVYIYLR
jgi:hypothetical protein